MTATKALNFELFISNYSYLVFTPTSMPRDAIQLKNFHLAVNVLYCRVV